MTLDALHQIELSLMRQAFEAACERVGLSIATEAINGEHERLAMIVQTLVERGFSDVQTIAISAAEAFANPSNLDELH